MIFRNWPRNCLFFFIATGMNGLSPSALAAPKLNFNATNCEFFVDGFAIARSYNMGWYKETLHSEIALGVLQGGAKRVGQLVRFIEQDQERFEEQSAPIDTSRKVTNIEFTVKLDSPENIIKLMSGMSGTYV